MRVLDLALGRSSTVPEQLVLGIGLGRLAGRVATLGFAVALALSAAT